MATLTLKTTFELEGLTLKELKVSKSCTEKTYFSRLKKDKSEWEEIMDDTIKDLANLQRRFPDQENEKIKECQSRIESCAESILRIDNLINQPMPVDKFVLWFAFDGEATKVFGEDAIRLFELLSDGNPHNILGDIETGGNQYVITDWEEF